MKKNRHYTRRTFIQTSFITGLGLTFSLYSCSKSSPQPDPQPTPDPDGKNDGKLAITGAIIPSRIDTNKGAELTIEGKGFMTGDQIIFEYLTNRYTVDTKVATDNNIVVALPEDLISGNTYRVTVKRGTQSSMLGSTVINIYFNANIPDREGMTIKGSVYAAGIGLANVVVSDGFEVTKTDENGIYYLPSTKKGKYVFVSIPGNYEVVTTGRAPQFFQRLGQAANVVETKDFELTAVNNDKHVVMVLGDMHLANRNGDINQFQQGFLADVNQSIQAYKNAGTKVYALTLGDMTWETYWYDNNYGLPQYLTEMNKIDTMVFNTMGNHDNDPKFVNDWGAEDRFRDVIGPTYYSFNIGKVHYIVLDNIEYLNTNNRNYNAKIVADQIAWLKKDLAMITDKNAPLVISMHIQLHTNPGLSNGNETTGYRLSNAQEFIDALNGFTKVHLLTGHTHINYNIERDATPAIMEHNTAAVCATWWWTGHPSYPAQNHICKDGAPGGYAIWEMDGNDLKWTYKGIGYPTDYQFRAYDLNKCHITKETFAPNYTGAEWNIYAAEYATANTNNEVLINVWNYDKDWKVEVTENGQLLAVMRVSVLDPLHIVSYSAQRLNVNAVPTADFVTSRTAHMFKVKASSPNSTLEIKVTDRFGKVYRETMIRPKAFGYQMT
jgi:UDP-2,3-diacylglucosamine pyrophosphatase LpxH